MNGKIDILVYGSLRKGEYNNPYFNMEYVKTFELPGFKMYSLGYYPGIKESNKKTDKIVVDHFRVTPESFRRITNMELSAGYSLKKVNVNNKDYWIYIYNGYVNEEDRVKDGDWCKYRRKIISY